MRLEHRQRTRLLQLASVLLFALFSYAFVRNFWVSDDAYIVFRTIDNALHGEGLRWNVAERVQAYTCPLWLLALVPITRLAGDPYFASLVLSAVTTAAVWIIPALWNPFRGFLVFALSMSLSSRTFMDYSSSGLENPLSHLLLAVFYTLWFFRKPSSPALLSFVAGLAFLNRMDSILLVAGPLWLILRTSWKGPGRTSRLRGIGLSLLPVFAWIAFSIVYYGAVFPNTYYAKMNHEADLASAVRQGLVYATHLALHDSVTAGVILSAVILGMSVPSTRGAAVSVILHTLYLISIGGDFMEGRMYSPSFVVSLLILARWVADSSVWIRHGSVVIAPVVLAVAMFSMAKSPLRTTSHYSDRQIVKGIADEKGEHYQATSLMARFLGGTIFPDHDWSRAGSEWKQRDKTPVVYPNLGFSGFHAGPGIHVVDRFALTDPLLARITGFAGRVGHIERLLPDGYLMSLATGENRISDAAVARIYDDVVLVTRGPLFSVERFRSILRIHSLPRGGYSAPYAVDEDQLKEYLDLPWVPERFRAMSHEELTRFLFLMRSKIRFPRSL